MPQTTWARNSITCLPPHDMAVDDISQLAEYPFGIYLCHVFSVTKMANLKENV